MGFSFYAYREKMTFVMLTVGYLILLSPLIPFAFFPEERHKFSEWNLLFPGVIFYFFMYVLTASLLKLFMRYDVKTNGIHIYRPPFHRFIISKDDLENVEYINSEDTSKVIGKSIEEQENFAENKDIIGFLKYIKEKSPLFRYFSIASSVKVNSTGHSNQYSNLKVYHEGGILRVKLKNGEEYFLSPRKPKKMHETIQKMLFS